MRTVGDARARWRWVGAMAAVAAAMLSGCYWTKEDAQNFEARRLAACALIDDFVAAGTNDAKDLLSTDAKRAGDLLVEYMTTAAMLRTKKAEAAVAFLKCDSDHLQRVFNDILDALEKAAQKGSGIYKNLKPFFGLLGIAAQQLNADVKARALHALNIAAAMRRVFEVDPTSFVGLDYGVPAGPFPLRDDLPVRGSITVWPRVTAADTATLAFTGLRLEMDCPRAPGMTVVVEAREGGFALNATADDTVFPHGWRAAFAQELLLSFRMAGAADRVVPFEQLLRLDFFLSRDFDELTISTDGFQPTSKVFGARDRAGDSHAWGFWASGDAAVGVPLRLGFEGLEPGARVEVFLATALAGNPAGYLGLPWMLDAASQVQVAAGEVGPTGHGEASFVPAEELNDRRVYLQGLVTSSRGKVPTAPLALDVETPFRRGDINADGAVNVSDVVACMGYLFGGGLEPACLRAADANASAVLDISDGVTVLYWLFAGGHEPPAPGPSFCGRDPAVAARDARLGCQRYAACR